MYLALGLQLTLGFHTLLFLQRYLGACGAVFRDVGGIDMPSGINLSRENQFYFRVGNLVLLYAELHRGLELCRSCQRTEPPQANNKNLSHKIQFWQQNYTIFVKTTKNQPVFTSYVG